ncbi:MAG: FKBP-type peptidyl-prolyl cis-trans isomerase [Bacteroidales bacterium]|nr:FKBP-type peptidyl-prolyl cis-trans isomerase [Bacteroidales bacterium]
MKTLKIIAAIAVLSAAVACNSGKPAATGEGAPTKAEIDTVSYLLGINFGSMIKGYNLGDLNFSEIKKGIDDFVNAKGNQRDTDFVKQFKINPEEMNRIMQAFIEKRTAYTASLNKAEQDKFFEDVKKIEGVQTSESGLAYNIKEAGNDNKPSEQDTVYVHYKLTLKDGSTIEEVAEDQPSVMLILNRVIPGWTEGLQLIGEGGKATLYVPAELGYGERGANGIEPNSPLVFDIQLDSVKHYVEPAPETK